MVGLGGNGPLSEHGPVLYGAEGAAQLLGQAGRRDDRGAAVLRAPAGGSFSVGCCSVSPSCPDLPGLVAGPPDRTGPARIEDQGQKGQILLCRNVIAAPDSSRASDTLMTC